MMKLHIGGLIHHEENIPYIIMVLVKIILRNVKFQIFRKKQGFSETLIFHMMTNSYE